MERLTYALVIYLSCCFVFLTLIKPSNSAQSGLGPQQLSQIAQNGRVYSDADIHKRADHQPPLPLAAERQTKKPTTPTKHITTSKVNDTSSNSADNSENEGYKGFIDGFSSPNTLKRMLVILLSITAIAVIYFVYRTIRLRRNRKTRKYGVLTTNSDRLEMAPLDQEEDDEDMTVFEANSRYK